MNVAAVLVTHAPLGQALYACAEHVLQMPPALLVADILPEDLPPPWVTRLVSQIMTLPTKDVVLFCDLYGSTPYHIATAVQRQLSLKGLRVHLISGVNMCMVLKVLTDSESDPDLLVERILAAAKRGMVHQSPT